MKKILLTIIFFLAGIYSLYAQILFSTTYSGGDGGKGTINRFTPASDSLTVLKSFENFAGGSSGDFLRASDGKLYKMGDGGTYNYGAVFSFDPSSSTYTWLTSFNNTNGSTPLGSLMQASDGKLYGMTSSGGSSGLGVIFSFDPVFSIITKLKDFDFTNGNTPAGNLIQARDGKLYGMTHGGGASGAGVIFSFIPSTSTYTKLVDFDGINGAAPSGSLMQANDAVLYGMTSGGGSSNAGVIFSFNPSSSTYKKLKDFSNSDGGNPSQNLIQAGNKKLYGMTSGGGTNNLGVIFSFDPLTSTYSKLKDFDGLNGAAPSGSFIQAGDGKLYAATASGGSNNVGTIFSLDPSSGSYVKLRDFDNTNGAAPPSNLTEAGDGTLYATTSAGGSTNSGVIFSFAPASFKFTKLMDLGPTNGDGPVGSLIQASDRKLYGITVSGGNNNAGVIFSYDVSTSAYTKLKNFDPATGSNPTGGLIQASDGKLYGMTYGGGSSGFGVIFSYDPVSSTYTKLKDFIGNDGHPLDALIQASDGKLYGFTATAIFSFDPSSGIYTKHSDFEGINGYGPSGAPMQASDGKLYGTTQSGGSSGAGVIFSFDPVSSTYTKLKDFDQIDGAGNSNTLVQAKNGKLYGMTPLGGINNSGIIFSFDPESSGYMKLLDFAGARGNTPDGSLMQASDGRLYGMTFFGRSIFSFDPSSSTDTTLKFYNSGNGSSPGGHFVEAKADTNKTGLIISISSQENSKIYSAPALISFVANAEDADGSITKVELYNATSLLGVEYYPPYNFSWKNIPVGNYIITAKAYDNKNKTTISAPLHISVVPNQPPIVSIISPHNQIIPGPTSIILEAVASDLYGSINKVELYNGETLLRTEYYAPYSWKWNNVPLGNYTISAKAFDNNGGVTTSSPVHITVAANKPPTVKITSPSNGQNVPGPATIYLQAEASDDGTIRKVELYNGETLLRTEYYLPYSFDWKHVPAGNYTITAKAYDNNGGVTTSAPIHISVATNQGPIVDIISPLNSQTFPGTARSIIVNANASDADGRVTKVQFYSGDILLHNEYYAPFTYNWQYVHAGNYTLTAKATDDLGKVTMSAPVSITVTSAGQSIAGSQAYVDDKIYITNAISIKVQPNPAKNVLNIQITGFQQDKRIMISVVSILGVTVKTLHIMSGQLMRMDVSSLRPGVYFLKTESGDKVLYTQFVKL